MPSRDAVLRYLDIFYNAGPLDDLLPLFDPHDFQFSGPFARYDSARAYVDALKADPPQDCAYTLISLLENANKIGVVYEFARGDLRLPMAQLFTFRGATINRILLLFDSAKFRMV